MCVAAVISYQKGTIKVVADKAQLFASDATAALSDPLNAAGALVAAGGAFLAVSNYQYVLEMIGMTGLLVQLLLYARGFDSIETLTQDIGERYTDAKESTDKLTKIINDKK